MAKNTWEFRCPRGWHVIQPWGSGFACAHNSSGLRVIIDCEEKADGRNWVHVSVSRKHWTPTHEDMALVKRDFIGPDRYCYSVWPPESRYVNIYKYCLHLWAEWDSADGRCLPEFSEILPEIGRSI